MLTRIFKNILGTVTMLLSVAYLASCTDELEVPKGNVGNSGHEGIGEIVQFSAGTTESEVTTRAASSYYMPENYRFVCRMYYKPNTNSDFFDTKHGTDQVAWLQVDTHGQGNSLYRQKTYQTPVQKDIYENDEAASTFYWQNRREHAFLAWTDLNKATEMTGGTTKGKLKFNADQVYEEHTGEFEKRWITKEYELYGLTQEGDINWTSFEDLYSYVVGHASDDNFPPQDFFSADQLANANFNYVHDETSWAQGLYRKRSGTYATLNEASGYDGWYVCQIFYDKLWYTPTSGVGSVKPYYGEDYYMVDGLPVARVITEGEGETQETKYWQCDHDGYCLYDETKRVTTFVYRLWKEHEDVEIVNEYPALQFDLTRPTKANATINDQPDICQALTIKAPTSSSDNRVNLYFKHQFAQVQVNLKSDDNSAKIEADQILGVELLGVSEKGYVFLDLAEDADTVRNSTYEPVDPTKFSDEILDDNEFGTKFEMFLMDEPAFGFLKSFNAITFGQLQAIRVSWTEDKSNPNAVVHVATFKIPDTKLINLESGIRYVWNMEIRRGTLAVIRTVIEPWIVPAIELDYKDIDGTIVE